MPGYDFRSPRLYVEAPLGTGAVVALNPAQAHYLTTVLRLKSGSGVLVFNGRDGEWNAAIDVQRRTASLRVGANIRAQTAPADLHYLFAPLKAARLDYMVQKAVEMGASRLQPVLTRHGQAARESISPACAPTPSRRRSNAAFFQCRDVAEPAALMRFFEARDPARWIVFCDEDAEVANPIAALEAVAPGSPLAVLIGPEGGFAEDERKSLLNLPKVLRICLGPRILRADTAAVAALTIVQAVAGDWR